MQVVIWAGDDIYALENITLLHPQDLYQEVCSRLLSKVVEDFGEGVEIHQIDVRTYRINVDKVIT
jgi:hypothetical protein